ncbi:hypothetical protein IMCC3317_04690 [Kordia antarctica]|uniref:Uncharacterized protein n=1 Tax=Kordia antarctica TaxID=1218801 RepID=A0A7L4ZEK3_9FLAO|nr:hypothetical protein IMCC3317_04690 [Kordia antarctica]
MLSFNFGEISIITEQPYKSSDKEYYFNQLISFSYAQEIDL